MLSPRGERPGRRGWAPGATLTLALLLALLAGLLALQPAGLLRAGLWLSGHDEVVFDQLRVSLHELELTGLALGSRSDERVADPLVGRLRVRYRPGDLLRGRIDEVSVQGLRLHGRFDQDGFRLEGLAGGASPGGPAQLPALPIPERVLLHDARLELTTPVGVLVLPFEARLRPEPERAVFVLGVDRAHLTAARGELSGTLHIEGEMPLDLQRPVVDPEGIATRLTASGRAALSAEALAVPGVARDIDGTGELEFAWHHGQLNASLSNVSARLGAIEPGWDAVAELLPAPWRFELAQPAEISARLIEDGIRLEGSGRMALATAGPQLQAALGTTVTLDANGRLRELIVPDGAIDLRALQWADMRLDRGSITVQGAGSAAAWQGSLGLDLAGAGTPLPDLQFDGASAQAELHVGFADGRLSASVRDSGVLRVAALSWADEVRVEGLELQLAPSSAPLLRADLTDGGVAWRQHLIASLPELEVAATAGGTPLRLRAQADELQVELAGDRDGLDAGRVVLSGGALSAPAYEVRASGIAATAAFSADGLDRDGSILVSIAAIAHEQKPPWFAPLRLAGAVQPRGDRVAFDLTLARTAGDVEMRVRGQHDLASAEGRAEVDLPPVEFAPGKLQPAALAPALADAITDVSGRLALDCTLTWDAAGDVRSALDLLVEDLAFSSGPARFAQVNGVIAFDRLAPLSTPPGQQLAVGLVDIGLPLTNGVLTFDLEPGQLLVEQLRWRFAEGRIRAAPFTIGSGEIRFSTTLTAERLKLDEIFALAQLDGLSGEGTMHGTLPITVAGAEAVIDNGELVSERPGWVRYRPDQAPAALQAGGENVNLLLQALENFRYKELRLGIDGRTDGDMDVRLHIAGANPDLYDGYPIEFNLNLEGALADVVRAGLAGYQIPERIRERMQGFGR